jgi:hypothetical protein
VSILLLRAADEEYLSRLAAFTEAHPEVEVVIVGYPGSGGTWQAIIPEPGGETIVVRYTAPGAARASSTRSWRTGEDTRPARLHAPCRATA